MPDRQLQSALVDRLSVKDLDLRGRRASNAGDSQAPGDYVTRRELDVVVGALQDQIDRLLLKAGK